MLKKIRYRIEYVFLRSIIFFFNSLSDTTISVISERVGSLWYSIDRKHRSIAHTNIGYAFPEMSIDERTRIVKESYKNIITTFMTFPRIGKFNISNTQELFEFQCTEYYEQAKARGKGVFLLTSHLGNWEFAAAAHSIKNNGLVAVAKDIHNPYIDKYIKALRTSSGIEVVRPRNAVFRLMRALKQGKTIAMLLDQNTLKHEAVFVNFFGRPAATQYAMALMAIKTGAAVVPGYVIKNPVRKGYIIRYEKPIIPTDEKNREQALIKWTQYFTDVIERHIKSMPAQWFWVHNRFKTRPEQGFEQYRQLVVK